MKPGRAPITISQHDTALQLLLPDFATEEQLIHAVFVHRTYMPAKLQCFIDHMIEALGKRADFE